MSLIEMDFLREDAVRALFALKDPDVAWICKEVLPETFDRTEQQNIISNMKTVIKNWEKEDE